MAFATRRCIGQANFRFCNEPFAVNPFFCAVSTALGYRLMVSEKEGAGPISYGGVAGLRQAPPNGNAA